MIKTRPVVLMTDFGVKDSYVGILKAIISVISPKAPIFDLTHGIKSFRIIQGALVLKSNFRYFPKGSIFVCVVDPGVGTKRDIVAVRTKDYVLIAPDNGLLSGIIKEEPIEEIRKITNPKFYLYKEISHTFHGRDIMAPVAAHLSSSKTQAKFLSTFKQIGPKSELSVHLDDLKVRKTTYGVEGKIVYFDQFGNAVTNIASWDITAYDLAEVYLENRKIGGLKSTYGELDDNQLTGILNSSDLLELAVKEDSARNAFKLQAGQKVTVKFHPA